MIFSYISLPILHNIELYIYIVRYKSSIKIPDFLLKVLSHITGGARRRGDPRLVPGSFVLLNKGSRHLVLWSLGNLTGLSEILRQGTGCVKGRC
jgi:hypothetical protein